MADITNGLQHTFPEPDSASQAPRNAVLQGSEVAQSCPTLCDPMDYSLPGSSVRGIFQARVLKWVAISFSTNMHYKDKDKLLFDSPYTRYLE